MPGRLLTKPAAHIARIRITAVLLAAIALSAAVLMPHLNATTTAVRSSIGQHVLENGLQAVWEEDHRQPLVAIEARIKGGLRGEGPYVGTGITHFIEHMLFKGTPTRAVGSIDQEVRRYGGSINAFTSMDTTGISLFVEAKYLKEGLDLVADIVQHALFDQAEFEKERSVIISEIQMNQDDPNRRLYHTFFGRHFLEHPYRHPILGYQELLEKLTVDDVRAFYTNQYQPQNITISCAGDLDGAAMPALIEELFGDWARGKPNPLYDVVAKEQPTASAKSVTVEMPVQSAYVMLGFSSTSVAEADLYPLDVLAHVLGNGESSRLYDALVRKEHVVDSIAAWNHTPYDPGVFAIQFRTAPEKADRAVSGIIRVIEDLKDNGVTDAEVAKAKRQKTAEYVFSLQTVEARAGDLANSLSMTGDPEFSRRYVDGIERVSASQVQDLARRYLKIDTRTTATIRPQGAATPVVAAVTKSPFTTTKMDLNNGAVTLVGVDHHLPMAVIVVTFKGGVRVEPGDRNGLSSLTAQMLTKGTKRRSALEIARYVESLGANLDAFSGRDGFGLVLQVLNEDVDKGLSFLHELLTEASFPEEELQLQRQLILQRLRVQQDDIFQVGSQLLRETYFGEHPYHANPLGTPESVAKLTRGDCQAFFRDRVTPSGMVLAVFGDVDEAVTFAALKKLFGTLKPGDATWPPRQELVGPSSIKEVNKIMDREQALVLLGFPGVTHVSPDREVLDVLTAVLSGMAGRLFQRVRETHGLSYSLGASHTPGWDGGMTVIYAATKPGEQARVLQLIQEELRSVVEQGFTAEEVDQAKRQLIGQHRMEVQSLSGLTQHVAIDELYGVGYESWRTYEDRVNAVSLDALRRAAVQYLTLDSRVQVIVSPSQESSQVAPKAVLAAPQ